MLLVTPMFFYYDKSYVCCEKGLLLGFVLIPTDHRLMYLVVKLTEYNAVAPLQMLLLFLKLLFLLVLYTVMV